MRPTRYCRQNLFRYRGGLAPDLNYFPLVAYFAHRLKGFFNATEQSDVIFVEIDKRLIHDSRLEPANGYRTPQKLPDFTGHLFPGTTDQPGLFIR